jgi:WD40 repeat protein
VLALPGDLSSSQPTEIRPHIAIRVKELKLAPPLGCAGREAEQMEDLAPVAPEAGAAEDNPRPLYTWAGPVGGELSLVRSYIPSDGDAPRLVATAGIGLNLCVWDTETGALLQALLGSRPGHESTSLVTYRRLSDGRPRIAAGSNGGLLSIWDGDDLQAIRSIQADPDGNSVGKLAVYEDPTSGSTRLVTG